MRKKLLFASLGLALGLVLLVLLRLSQLDASGVQRFVEVRVGEALGAPAHVAGRELSFLPPTLHLRGLTAGAPDAERHLEVEEVRLGLSSLGLLAGEVVLRSVEVVRPRLSLSVDDRGVPRVAAAREGEAARAADLRGGGEPDAAPLLAITRIRVRDGALAAGRWRVERIEASGGLRFDLGLALEVEATAPGVARLREGRIDVWGAGSPDLTWRARATLEDVALDAFGALAGEGVALRGRGALSLDAEGTGEALDGGALAFEVPSAEVRGDGFALDGRVALDAELGGLWQLDLGGAELRLADALHKPAGEALLLSARPDAQLPPRSVRDIRLESAPFSLQAGFGAAGGPPLLTVTRGRVDLAALARWWTAPWRPQGGAILVHGASFGADSASWQLVGAFESARLAVPLPDAMQEAPAAPAIAVDGPFALAGTRIESGGLHFAMGGQRAVLGGAYDVASRRFDATFEAFDLDLGALLTALAGEAVLEGRLSARAAVHGEGRLESLEGEGRFELVKGSIPGADFPWPVEVHDPRLATGEEGRAFDRLSGRFALTQGLARFEELVFQHPYLGAYLRGDVALSDGALDLTGDIELSEELDAGLGGEGRRRVLPVRRVHGSLADPRFDMDRDAMAATFGRYADNLRAGAGAAR